MSMYKDLYPDAYPDYTLDDDDYELVLQATGADVYPVTLWDIAQAQMAEQRYIRAILDGQLRRGAHRRGYGGDNS